MLFPLRLPAPSSRPMPVSLRQRSLTTGERAGLHSSLGRILLFAIPGVLFRYLLGFIFLMLLGMVVVTVLSTVLEKATAGVSFLRAKPHLWQLGLFIVAFWGPVVLLPVWFASRAVRRDLRRHRARASDLAGDVACVATFQDARFVSLVDEGNREFLVYEFDPGRTLLIDGERPGADRALFGLPEQEINDEDDEAPYEDEEPLTPFPNSCFDLHWLPHSGRLLQIETRGSSVAPLRVLLDSELALPESKRFVRDAERDVLILDRDLDAWLSSAKVSI